jgi:death on curing protein
LETSLIGEAGLGEEILYPSMEEVARLYQSIIKMTGGDHGYLSRSNLEYLLDTVKDVGERLQKEQAIVKKASFLLYNVVVIHPFLNGNKRTAYELVRLFLRSNGLDLEPDAKEALSFLLRLASGKASENEVERWVAMHLTEFGGD